MRSTRGTQPSDGPPRAGSRRAATCHARVTVAARRAPYGARPIDSRGSGMRARTRMAALVAGGVIGLATTTAAARAASDYPVVYDWPAAIVPSEVQPTPPGANDWTCRPSAEHPRAVVLVPGLTGNGGRDYYAAAPLLANHGYCVFMFDYRDRGQESIEDAAAELSPFIDRVLSTTGAARVDVVGHSQGGMMPRYYMKFLGGAAKVHALVGISPINH